MVNAPLARRPSPPVSANVSAHMVNGVCRLCGEQADLRLSHIIPAFVFRWLRETSGTGHIRTSDEPNLRVQDGIKRPWLCGPCEERLNRSETEFATKVFHPYLASSGTRIRYSTWLMQFCTSLSWRVLKHYLEDDHLKKWEPETLERARTAESAWRGVLLGTAPHAGACEQHILPLDRIESTTGALAANINRYLMRAIHMDICRGSQSIFTYTKIGRFIVLGFVHEPQPNQWKGTKVNANEGWIEPKQYVLPKAFGEYLNEKARDMAEDLDRMSDRQYEKVDQTFRQNVDRYVESDAFKAMNADVEMFGTEAFSKRGQK